LKLKCLEKITAIYDNKLSCHAMFDVHCFSETCQNFIFPSFILFLIQLFSSFTQCVQRFSSCYVRPL